MVSRASVRSETCAADMSLGADAPIGLDPFTWTSEESKATSNPPTTALSPMFPPNKPPAHAFPAAQLPAFLKAIDGSTEHQGELVKQLNAAFKGVTTQACIKATLDEVAERAGARSGKWTVKAEAWRGMMEG